MIRAGFVTQAGLDLEAELAFAGERGFDHVEIATPSLDYLARSREHLDALL